MAQKNAESFSINHIKYEELYEGTGISASVYNLIMGGLVLYGIVVNIILCAVGLKYAASMNPLVLIIGYVVLVLGGTFMIHRAKSNALRFVGYNMIVIPLGLVLSLVVSSYGGMQSGVVQQAFIYTAIITAVMVMLSIAFPAFFSKLGPMLFGCLLGMLLAYVVVWLLKIDTIMIAYFGAALFSLYIGYDFWRSQQYPRTLGNAMISACAIYLDIINLFLRLLRILGNSRSRN